MASPDASEPADAPGTHDTTKVFRQTVLNFAYVPTPSPSPEKHRVSKRVASPAPRRVTRSGSSRPDGPSTTPASAKSSSAKPASKASSTKPAPRRPVAPPRPSGPTNKLTDSLSPNLLVMFVGVNPGIRTGETGHAYAHPSNRFWKLLHESGLTARRHPPSDTHALGELYRYGNTNVVVRPTRDASMLGRAEMDAGVAVVEEKVRRYRPRVVCLVGKGIWEAVEKAWKGRGRRVAPFKYGFRPESERMGGGKEWEGARVFAATTTSGLAAGMGWDEKLAIWTQLGEWVAERRAEDEGGVEGKEAEEEGKGEEGGGSGEKNDDDGGIEGDQNGGGEIRTEAG